MSSLRADTDLLPRADGVCRDSERAGGGDDSKPVTIDGTNNFRGTGPTTAGTTTATIIATDPSGNSTTKQFEVDVTGTGKTFTYDEDSTPLTYHVGCVGSDPASMQPRGNAQIPGYTPR
jgi:hypothetical protein